MPSMAYPTATPQQQQPKPPQQPQQPPYQSPYGFPMQPPQQAYQYDPNLGRKENAMQPGSPYMMNQQFRNDATFNAAMRDNPAMLLPWQQQQWTNQFQQGQQGYQNQFQDRAYQDMLGQQMWANEQAKLRNEAINGLLASFPGMFGQFAGSLGQTVRPAGVQLNYGSQMPLAGQPTLPSMLSQYM